tara:strand:- start:1633 stop:1857 length:225 start_codon:yes stop_codon:yes gene_type:complete
MEHSITKTELEGTIFSVKRISIEKNTENNQVGCRVSVQQNDNIQSIVLTKKELSEFIGLMLHVQSSIKRDLIQK